MNRPWKFVLSECVEYDACLWILGGNVKEASPDDCRNEYRAQWMNEYSCKLMNTVLNTVFVFLNSLTDKKFAES